MDDLNQHQSYQPKQLCMDAEFHSTIAELSVYFHEKDKNQGRIIKSEHAHAQHFCNIYLLMTLSELKRPRGEAHRQPAVPGRGEQAVQRGQPGLQRQQRHHHGAQHRRVPGQPVQPAQRLPAGQLAAQPPHRHPSHQRHAQLCRYPRLALTQTHRGPSDQNISTRMCPYAPAPS